MSEEYRSGGREKPGVPKPEREPPPKRDDWVRKIEPLDEPGDPPEPEPTEDSGNEIAPRERDYPTR